MSQEIPSPYGSTIVTPTPAQKKTMAAARKLLADKSWSEVQKGLEMIDAAGDPVLWQMMVAGIQVMDDGNLFFKSPGEVADRVKKPNQRRVALESLARTAWAERITAWRRWEPNEPPLTLLACFPNLTSLAMNGCSDADLDTIAQHPNITSLSLSDCAAVPDLRRLAPLTRLRTLSLARIRGLSDLGALAALPALTELKLHECKDLRDLSALSSLPALRSIGIFGVAPTADLTPLVSCRITEVALVSPTPAQLGVLERMSQLEHLRMTQWSWTGNDITPLRGCQALKSLTLNGLELHDPSFVRGGAPTPRPLRTAAALWAALRAPLDAGFPELRADNDHLAAQLLARDWAGAQATHQRIFSSPDRGNAVSPELQRDRMELEAILKELPRWQAVFATQRDRLAPGATLEELAAFQAIVPCPLPAYYVELMREANGTAGDWVVGPNGPRFLSVKEAMQEYVQTNGETLYSGGHGWMWDYVPFCCADGDGWWVDTGELGWALRLQAYNHEGGRRGLLDMYQQRRALFDTFKLVPS